MLNLFYKPWCPYSVRVLKANETIGAPLTLRDVAADPAAKAELLQKGGKTQSPFLEDTERAVMMYESLDIIEYLHTHYGNGAAPVVPPAANVCPIE